MNKLEPICIVGAGGHGRVLAAQMKACGWTNICFADSNLVDSDPLVRFASLEDCRESAMIIAIGDNLTRKSLFERAVELGISIESFVAANDMWFGRELGRGSMVLKGAIVNNGAVIGTATIINSGAIIEHDCKVGDFCHIAPGAVIAGDCILGSNVFVGANATVLPGLEIADNVVIGAGAVVTRSIEHGGVFSGVPAKQSAIHGKGSEQ